MNTVEKSSPHPAASVAKAPIKSASLPAAKPAVKSVAKVVSKPAVKNSVVAKTKAAAPAKTAAKPAAKSKPKTAPKDAEKNEKPKKIKLVRDSFTVPKNELIVLDDLKLRALSLKVGVKKSELLRAGIKALAAMGDAAFLAAVKAVPALKTGRPKK